MRVWRKISWRKEVWRSWVRRKRAKTLRAERRCPNKGSAILDLEWPTCVPHVITPVGSCAQRTKGQKGTTDFGPGVDSSENNKSSRRGQSRGKPTRSQITTPSTRGHATSQEGRAVVRLWFQEALSWREPAVVQAKSRNGYSPKPREPDTAIYPARAQDLGSSYITTAAQNLSRSLTTSRSIALVRHTNMANQALPMLGVRPFDSLIAMVLANQPTSGAASCIDSLSRTYSEKLPCELSFWLPNSSTADVRDERWRRLQDAN